MDARVDILAVEIHRLMRRCHLQLEVAVERVELRETRHQPAYRECRRHLETQQVLVGLFLQLACAVVELVECAAHGARVGGAFRRQRDAAQVANEKLDAEPRFQRRDVTADCTLRDRQLGRGIGEARVARRGFENTDRIQRRQAARHAMILTHAVHDENFLANQFNTATIQRETQLRHGEQESYACPMERLTRAKRWRMRPCGPAPRSRRARSRLRIFTGGSPTLKSSAISAPISRAGSASASWQASRASAYSSCRARSGANTRRRPTGSCSTCASTTRRKCCVRARPSPRRRCARASPTRATSPAISNAAPA